VTRTVPTTERPNPRPGALLALAPLGFAALALLVVGVIYVGAAWGAVCLAAGLLATAIIGVSAVLRRWLEGAYGVLLIVAAGLVVAGAVLGEAVIVGLGVLALVVVGASAPIAVVLAGRAGRDGGGSPAVNELSQLLRQIHDTTMLSDHAKRTLFRERELHLLRDAIEGDIGRGEYDAAVALCDELAAVFGYRKEAESFRARIEQAREDHYQHEVAAAMSTFDELLAARDWGRVHQEAARIRRLYAESHLVADLDRRILSAREEHKVELEGEFLAAVERDDVPTAMDLLKQLDRYLDAEEGQRLTEVAQGVVARHRENLGVQFKLAVSDHRWAEASRIGEVIVHEFPNTKMADEVRSMQDALRSRAQAAITDG
jgi:hypothetical protein